MNLPLNIDIQQIFLHLFNFAILSGGLYFLLYKPVKKFMDQRSTYYQDMDREANENLAAAERMKAEAAERLDQLDDEIRAKRAEAASLAEKRAAQRLEEANQKAEKILDEARNNATQEQQKIVAAARAEIVNLAAEAAEKVVAQTLDASGR